MNLKKHICVNESGTHYVHLSQLWITRMTPELLHRHHSTDNNTHTHTSPVLPPPPATPPSSRTFLQRPPPMPPRQLRVAPSGRLRGRRGLLSLTRSSTPGLFIVPDNSLRSRGCFSVARLNGSLKNAPVSSPTKQTIWFLMFHHR